MSRRAGQSDSSAFTGAGGQRKQSDPYGDEKTFDSGCLDSGFLSGTLDSASNIEDECAGASAATSSSSISSRHAYANPRPLPDVPEEFGDEKKVSENICMDSGLIVDDTEEPFESESSIETTDAAGDDDATILSEEERRDLLIEAFAPDEDGDTTLHDAIAQGFVEVVFSLVRLAPSSKYLNVRNGSNLTPLHLAVLRSQPWPVRRLVLAGCNVTARDRHGNTALHLACKAGNITVARCLLQPPSPHEMAVCPKPCSSDAPLKIPQDPELRNDDGLTCLHLAALGGHYQLVQLLLVYGADVNVVDGASGRTCLHACARLGMRGMCLFLIARCGADPDVDCWAGRTAADAALGAGHAALAEELCQMGSSLSLNENGDDDDEEDDDEEEDEEVRDETSRMNGIESSGAAMGATVTVNALP